MVIISSNCFLSQLYPRLTSSRRHAKFGDSLRLYPTTAAAKMLGFGEQSPPWTKQCGASSENIFSHRWTSILKEGGES